MLFCTHHTFFCKFHIVCPFQPQKDWWHDSVQASSTQLDLASLHWDSDISAINQFQTIQKKITKNKKLAIFFDWTSSINLSIHLSIYLMVSRKVHMMTESAEYTDRISSERWDFPDECRLYDTQQSDCEVLVMLELLEMQSTPLLPSLPCSVWLWVIVPDKVLSIGQIGLNCVLMLNWISLNRSVLIFDDV